MNNRYLYLLIALVAVSRLIPHPLNVTPVGALALFSGAYIDDKRALLIPLIAVLIGDIFIGLYAGVVMAAVYLGFIASTMVGRLALNRKRTLARFTVAVSGAAILFYVISNIGMWYYAYPRTVVGLFTCYVDGLPFLWRSFVGDVIYSVLLFGVYEGLLKYSPLQNSGHLKHAC